jgi:hypothetical protein
MSFKFFFPELLLKAIRSEENDLERDKEITPKIVAVVGGFFFFSLCN